MPGCSALNCSNRSENGFRLFRLPEGKRNEERIKLWVRNIGRKSLPAATVICQVHFSEDQFEQNRKDGKKLLKWNAVPTIFDHREPQVARKPSVKRPHLDLEPKPKIAAVKCSGSETDMKLEIKEEVPFSEVLPSQNKRKCFRSVTVTVENSANSQNKDCEAETKTEIKEETLIPDMELEVEQQFSSESFVMNVEADLSDFCPRDRQLFSSNPVIKVKHYSKSYELDIKSETEEELW